MPRFYVLLIPLMLCLACSDDAERSAQSTPADSTREITTDDVSSMMLTASEIGDQFQIAIPVLQETGRKSNDEIFEGASNAPALRNLVKENGRITGYQQILAGPVAIWIMVDLYETEEGASRVLAELLNPNQSQEGFELEFFETPTVGVQSGGTSIKTPDGGFMSVVVFQREDVLGWALLVAPDQSPTTTEGVKQDAISLTESLSRKVDERLAEQ